MRDTTQLKKWRENMTPEQKEAWKKSISTGMKKPHSASGDMDGVVVRIMKVKHGMYTKGSCRSINVYGVDWDVDEIRRLLIPVFKRLKDSKTIKKSYIGAIDV